MDRAVPIHIGLTVLREYFPARGLRVLPPRSSVTPAVDPATITRDDIRRTLRSTRYFRVDGGKNADVPPTTTIVVLDDIPWGGADVDEILPAIAAGSSGEILIIAPEAFLLKNPLLKRVDTYRRTLPPERRLIVLPRNPFAANPLKSAGTPRHTLLTAEDRERVLSDLKLDTGASGAGGYADIALLYESDPTALWLGAVAGDLGRVERTTPSHVALVYRKVRPAKPLIKKSR
jgi:DNA-directed RNA polymerase subunit H (RpoH/RPB5)